MSKQFLSAKRINELEELIKTSDNWSKKEGKIIDMRKEPEVMNCVIYGYEVLVEYLDGEKQGFDITDISLNELKQKKYIKEDSDLIGKKIEGYRQFRTPPYLPLDEPMNCLMSTNIYFD